MPPECNTDDLYYVYPQQCPVCIRIAVFMCTFHSLALISFSLPPHLTHSDDVRDESASLKAQIDSFTSVRLSPPPSMFLNMQSSPKNINTHALFYCTILRVPFLYTIYPTFLPVYISTYYVEAPYTLYTLSLPLTSPPKSDTGVLNSLCAMFSSRPETQ